MANKISGDEHPLCDSVQLIMTTLFFAVWIGDSFSHFVFGWTTIVDLAFLPLRFLFAVATASIGVYLGVKSHAAVFGEAADEPKLVDTGVFSWVRHPMYLGTLLFCLAFFFAMPSLLSLAVWIIFFILYDKMTAYEERDLIQKLGEEYIDYQERVPKWIPRPKRRG